jgi:aspartyl-tRNA(Asn)/glutamyl-tRNA(Gln) amidotransferase subunit B
MESRASAQNGSEDPLVAGYQVVIGLETHVQLATASKQFSDAPTRFGAAPNSQANAVDLALPGVLPVMNAASVRMAIAFGLAVGATIHRRSTFERKNYFYPDLPKGYQISQYETPIVEGGRLAFYDGGRALEVRLVRAHLEEDAGKSLHAQAAWDEALEGGAGRWSGIDLNRAGTPLLEIVTEPDLRSSRAAAAYARALHALVVWLGICDGNLAEGSFRCDANVSVRKPGEPLGTRCEIKNLNSFRFLEKAIDYEVRRQIDLLEDGGRIVQETRLYDPERGETRGMRSKEDAQDYRYFPDPDLPPLVVGQELIDEVAAALPELPQAMAARLQRDYGLPAYDAAVMTQSKAYAAFFEACARALPGKEKLAANWLMGEVASQLNREQIELDAAPLAPAQLVRLVERIADGTISGKQAKEVFAAIWAEGRRDGPAEAVDAVIDARGLRQQSDSAALEAVVDAVLAANAKSVAEFRAGKDKAFNALVGQAMKATQGKANPALLGELLRKKLAAAG